MPNIRDFNLTSHAINRLRERNPDFSKKVDWITETALRKKATYDYISDAVEEKAFLNNSIFVMNLNDKYGYDNRYCMFVKDSMVFVGVMNERGNVIVTTIYKDEHYLPQIRNSGIKAGWQRRNTNRKEAELCVV